MPASKHFFEGYCRAKDMLHTLATKITQATITRPWTIKSEGRIINTNAQHPQRNEYHDKYHVCLKKELENGDIINFFMIDHWNTVSNNIWGFIRASVCDYDSCVASEGRFSHTLVDRWRDFQYYANQLADTEAAPQHAWYWMWVDDDCIVLNVFGNSGGAGTATPTRGILFFGKAKSINQKFEDTLAIGVMARTNLQGSKIADFVNPASAPHDWSSEPFSDTCQDIIKMNNPLSNGKLSVRLPKITQTQHFQSGTRGEQVATHTFGSGQMLVMPIGTSGLLRSDIITVDELKADYINTQGTATQFSQIADLALIKRMESAHTLSLALNGNNVNITWHNPKLCHGVKIVKKINTAPSSHTDGDEVFNLTSDTGLLIDQEQTFTDENNIAGNHYYYRAFAYDSLGTYSVPITSAQADIQL